MKTPTNVNHLLSHRIDKLRTDYNENIEELNPNITHSSFEKLAIYCFENIQISNTNHKYIGENLMKKDNYLKGFNRDIAIKFLKSKNYIDVHGQNLDSVFRSLSALIRFNEDNLSDENMNYILDYILEFYELKI